MKRIKKLVNVVTASAYMTCIQMNTVMAATDTSSVTKPLDSLKTLLLSVIGAVGVIILSKNVMEFAQAYQHNDSATMNSALKGIAGGAMMAGITSVLGVLGF